MIFRNAETRSDFAAVCSPGRVRPRPFSLHTDSAFPMKVYKISPEEHFWYGLDESSYHTPSFKACSKRFKNKSLNCVRVLHCSFNEVFKSTKRATNSVWLDVDKFLQESRIVLIIPLFITATLSEIEKHSSWSCARIKVVILNCCWMCVWFQTHLQSKFGIRDFNGSSRQEFWVQWQAPSKGHPLSLPLKVALIAECRVLLPHTSSILATFSSITDLSAFFFSLSTERYIFSHC